MFYVDLRLGPYKADDPQATRVVSDRRNTIEKIIEAWDLRVSGKLDFVFPEDGGLAEVKLSEGIALVITHLEGKKYKASFRE